MKRRDGSPRRQVLDINHSSSSWKNKYQAIAERKINGSGDSAPNPLAKLVGSYASESDEDEDNSKSKSSLDAKVEEFMKEVESTKSNDDSSNISCAWQECFDEGTGYPYYWNMNTNEVTWEPPPELVAYQAAVAAKVAQTQAKVKAQAQQAQWVVEQTALGLTPEYPQKRIPTAAPSHKKPPKSVVPPAAAHFGSKKNRLSNKRPSSESDDEKIEMITSWADEESDDEDDPTDCGNQNKEGHGVQPKAPPSGPSKSAKSVKPPKPVPSPNVMFGPQLPSTLPNVQNSVSSKAKGRSRNGSIEESNDVESKVVIQKLRRLKTESDVIVGTRERVPIRKSLNRSRSGSPNDCLNVNSTKSKLGDNMCENEPVTEKSLLTKLNKQVQILKDLGGIVPVDIKDLLNSASKTSAISSTSSADSIIAMIEMEQPPDHKQDDKMFSSLKAAEHRMQKVVQKIQAEKAVNGTEKSANQAQKPTSFALIAGYGDDSDQEENADSDTSVNSRELSVQMEKPTKEKTLFPILACEDSSKEDVSVKTGGKFAYAPELPVPAKVNLDSLSKPALVLDSGPGTGQKRRKRLDIGAVHAQPLPSPSSVASDSFDEASKSSKSLQAIKSGGEGPSSVVTSYTTTWSSTSTYASDPTANDRRGFGFQVVPSSEEEPNQSNKSKKGKIQFIKAETINPQQGQDDSTNVREDTKESDSKSTTSKSREDGELHGSLSSLAQLVIAKLQFLSEGKEPVSPVQAMAIQIETLVSAWNAGALTNSFLQRWLQSTGAELVQLERAAAPQGWAVQWDREYKRYFYCNLATKETQWDYPLVPEEGLVKADEREVPKPVQPQTQPQPQARVATPPPDDEDAMELCTTPPPEEEEEAEAESEMQSRPPSPSPSIGPPSKRPKTDDENGESNDPSDRPPCPAYQPPLPTTPPPPLPSSPPPPPPPPETPPPPPPGTPPPQPSSAASSARPRLMELGEPLPPGVDSSDVPFIAVRPAMPPAMPPTMPTALSGDLSSHMVAHGVGVGVGVLNPLQTVGPLHPGSVLGVPVMAMQYSATVGSYAAPPPTEAMLASFNHPSAVDYMGYMGVYAGPAGPMPVTSVAAPPLAYTGPVPQAPTHPPAHLPLRKKEALMSELNSFYSDIASLDSNSMDATEDDTSQDATAHEQSHVKSSTPPVPLAPCTNASLEDATKHQLPPEAPSVHLPSKSQSSSQESTIDNASIKKRKKPKLAPGLTLKKKGVSNLVAKWQQVQQEVWKDYQEEEGVD